MALDLKPKMRCESYPGLDVLDLGADGPGPNVATHRHRSVGTGMFRCNRKLTASNLADRKPGDPVVWLNDSESFGVSGDGGIRLERNHAGGGPAVFLSGPYAVAKEAVIALDRVANVADTARNQVIRSDPEEAERYRVDAAICRGVVQQATGGKSIGMLTLSDAALLVRRWAAHVTRIGAPEDADDALDDDTRRFIELAKKEGVL